MRKRTTSLLDYFGLAEYKKTHKRHDPVGSEDADVNNDGKVDANDKYLLAKRRLYKQYQQMQKTKKPSDISTPQLENNMIKLSALINLQSLKEEEDKKAPSMAPDAGEKEGDKKPDVAMKLKKLKSMQMTPDQEKKVDEMLAKMEELTGNQKKLDVDGDGEIEASDLAQLRAKKDEVVLEGEGEDHEVSMGTGLLDDIIKNATELKEKMGQDEKDVPAWIQDHISQAQNFINQANTNYHEHEKPEDTPHPEMDAKKDGEELNEVAPEGWEKTVKSMKKHKEIDNPWALAHWMKKKGYHPSKKES